MAAYDDQLKALRARAKEAIDNVDGLQGPEEHRERVRQVLVYVALVLERTDASLVPPSSATGLTQYLAQVGENPGFISDGRYEEWLNGILDAAARLPTSASRDFEQVATNAAATFQRSARQRLAAIENEMRSTQGEISAAKGRIDELGTDAEAQVNQRFEALGTSISEVQSGFEARLRDYESNLETEREASITQRGEQAQAFQTAQAERSERASKALADLETELRQRADDAVEGLETSRERVAALVELVTTSTTSEGFGGEANAQKSAADLWRWIAVGLGLIAAGVAIYAVIDAVGGSPTTAQVIAKVAAATAIFGVAGYAAKQSSDHRAREVRARRVALELAAFGPFSQALANEEAERNARTTFIDRVFTGGADLNDEGDAAITSTQVGLVGQLLDSARKFAK